MSLVVKTNSNYTFQPFYIMYFERRCNDCIEKSSDMPFERANDAL